MPLFDTGSSLHIALRISSRTCLRNRSNHEHFAADLANPGGTFIACIIDRHAGIVFAGQPRIISIKVGLKKLFASMHRHQKYFQKYSGANDADDACLSGLRTLC